MRRMLYKWFGKRRHNREEGIEEDLNLSEPIKENIPHIQLSIPDQIYGAIVGSCIGDALGVPVEFKSRVALMAKPIEGMTGFGTFNQPAGTWSDDSSMSLCTVEALVDGYSLSSIAGRFLMWYKEGYWTPHGEVFDIGNTTKLALDNIKSVPSPEQAGLYDEYNNGNGSLMRILPISFITYQMPFMQRAEIVSEVSSITHAHRRSIIACIILVELASNLLLGFDRFTSYTKMQDAVKEHLGSEMEVTHFPLVFTDISDRPAESIRSGGYVVDTVEAAVWSLLKYDSFRDVVLAAVNLGGDTDTTGCIAGGLAGLAFGHEGIPSDWVNVLARKDDIEDLAKRFLGSLSAEAFRS